MIQFLLLVGCTGCSTELSKNNAELPPRAPPLSACDPSQTSRLVRRHVPASFEALCNSLEIDLSDVRRTSSTSGSD